MAVATHDMLIVHSSDKIHVNLRLSNLKDQNYTKMDNHKIRRSQEASLCIIEGTTSSPKAAMETILRLLLCSPRWIFTLMGQWHKGM